MGSRLTRGHEVVKRFHVGFHLIHPMFVHVRYRLVTTPAREYGQLFHQGSAFLEDAERRPECPFNRFAVCGKHGILGIRVTNPTAKAKE